MSADDPLPAETPADPGYDEDRRRLPRTIGGWFYLVVLAATGIGIVVVAIGNWRVGTRWIAGALLFAALLVLLLPRFDAVGAAVAAVAASLLMRLWMGRTVRALQ